MASYIGVDVGGTFTDLSFIGEEQTLQIAKSPTTPNNYPDAIERCIEILSENIGKHPKDVLQKCTNFIHGSTIVTNAVVEGKVAKVGFIVTKGFRDILTLREGGKEDCYNIHEEYSQPFVPRYLTIPVTERINAEGGVEVPLDEQQVIEALDTLFEDYKVDSIAVCFLWSIVNPVHENRVKELAFQHWPNRICIISSETNPIIREYRRAVSTVVEASVRSIAEEYMRNVNSRLKERGYRNTLYMVTSSGAILPAEEAGKRGLELIGSGPAMAPIGANWLASIEGIRSGNLIVTDMGGTSFDITVVTDGQIVRTRESKVRSEILGISAIDARCIGSGGGSIAWIDPGGLIHVGPESAGAIPGPASYNRGGKRATVTDANVVLGYINPDYFLAGSMQIEPKLAQEAIKKDIADPLTVDVQQAAFTIWSTVNVNMVSAIQDVTIWHGVDPRQYLLVSGGGAGNCHAVALARSLGISKLLIPKFGGVLSAVGGLVADMCADFSGSYFTSSKYFDFKGVNELLERLEGEARLFLARLNADNNSEIEFSTEARYSYQVWELKVKMSGNRIIDRKDLQQLTDAFHKVHEQVFSIHEPKQNVEFVHWTARAIVKQPELKLKELKTNGTNLMCAIVQKRQAYFHEAGGMVETIIYRGDKLSCGNTLSGPAIIEEATTTIVVPPGARATVTKYGNYWIDT